MFSQARRPASPSSPPMTSNSSSRSCSLSCRTRAPRLGSSSTSPSDASTFRASRSGVREMPSISQSWRSGTRPPSGMLPSTMWSRSRVRISSCRDWSSRSESAPALRAFEVASLGIRGFIGRNISVDGEGVDQNVHHILVEVPSIECNMAWRSEEESMTQHQGRHFVQIPGPSPVPDRVLRAMDMPVIDHRSLQFAELGRAVFEGCQKIFKTAGPVIIFPSSGTGAWEAAIVNTLSPGDKVLMVETGHFATLWRQMAARWGIDVDFMPGDWRHGADPAAIEARLSADAAHD